MLNIFKFIFNSDLFTFYFGGGSSPTQNTTYQTNIPEYAEPYVTTMLGATEKQLYKYGPSGEIVGFQPYKAYTEYDKARGGTGETVAGFTPMQTGAMRGIQGYQLPGQTQFASNLAGRAGLNSMMAGRNYMNMATNPYATQAFMSPYIENALAPELREAARQSAIQGQQNQAQAVMQGAFGGSRSAIVEAERQRNLGQQQADIYGKGMQNAFQAAQQAQQFGADIGLKGYGQAGDLASTVGGLGQQQYGQELGLMGKQLEVGAQQQQYEQQRLNQIIQDYATSQQYPLMQLGVLSNMLRGLPMQAATTQMYQAQPSMMSQMAGGLGTGMALYGQAKQAGFNVAEGGHITEKGIKRYAKGGITGEYAVSDIVSKLSDAQLNAQLQNPNTTPEVKEAAVKEAQRRAEMRGMAGGGIVAFSNGGGITDEEAKELGYKNAAHFNNWYNSLPSAPKEETTNPEDLSPEHSEKVLAANLQQMEEDVKDEPSSAGLEQARQAQREKNTALRDIVRNAMDNQDLSTQFDKPRGITTMADMEAAAAAESARDARGAKDARPNIPDAVRGYINAGVLEAIQKKPAPQVEAASTNKEPPAQVVTEPTVEEQAVSAHNLGTSGLGNAPQGIRTGPPNAEAAPVTASAETKPAGITPEDELATYASQLKDVMGRTPQRQAEIARKEREALGIVSPYAAEIQKLEEKKRKIEGSSKDEYMDRLAEFLMTWGSLPGPTLVAANQAGRMFIANSIADKKERKKLLDGLDASMSDINKAQYLEKLGEHKEAAAKIESAGKNFFEVNEKLLVNKQKKAELQNAMERTMATLSSEESRARAKNLLDERLKNMEVNKATDFMNQVQIRVKALVAKGAPADENTLNKAMTEIIEETKGLDAKMLSALASSNQAIAALSQAGTAQDRSQTEKTRADTERERARVEARKQFRSDLLTETMKPENDKAISSARKSDKDKGLKITDPNSEERKVRKEIEKNLLQNPAYKDLLSSDDVTSVPDTAAPKPAAPKPAAANATPNKPTPDMVKGLPPGATIGNHEKGKGWQVLDKDGKLLGHTGK